MGIHFPGIQFLRLRPRVRCPKYSASISLAGRRRGHRSAGRSGISVSISFADSISGLKTESASVVIVPCPRVLAPAASASIARQRLRALRRHGQDCADQGPPSVFCDLHGMRRQRAGPRNCEECGGDGRVVPDGQSGCRDSCGSRALLRECAFPGEGDAGLYGGPAGDLYVITNVAPHPFFGRVGEHIHCTLPISFSGGCAGGKGRCSHGRWKRRCPDSAGNAERAGFSNAGKGSAVAAAAGYAGRSVGRSSSRCAPHCG